MKKPETESSDTIVELNPAQLIMALAPQRVRVLQCGRGSGKSTAAAIDIKDIMYDMPRSKNFILQETYQQAYTRTLPSTIKALAVLGLHKDLHYFIGRKPPRSWKIDECYEPPEDPKRSIFFLNGTCFDLLSQDTNSRGGNYSSGLGDEAQDLDPKKIQSEVIPTLRADYKKFGNRRTYRRLCFYCSMPRIRRAEWIFEYEKLAQENPEEYLYLSAPSTVNKHNLPPDWFRDQKRILMPSEYDIEIMNIRPKKVIGGFYQFFDDRIHSYTGFNNDYLDGILDNGNGYNPEDFEGLTCLQDGDLDFRAELDIAMDYGAWFNGIVTGQERKDTFRFLSGMSIGDGERFEDLLLKWCDYYRFHQAKVVNYWYDHTAQDRDARSEMYPEIVKRVLSSHGWFVNEMYIGQQPSHDDRYRFMGYIYRGGRSELPQVLVNRHHCKWLIIALNNANVRQGRNGFEKDKRPEQDKKIDQRTTTHYTDAHDTLLMGKYASRLQAASYVPGPRM